MVVHGTAIYPERGVRGEEATEGRTAQAQRVAPQILAVAVEEVLTAARLAARAVQASS